jgi:hypothetical protein
VLVLLFAALWLWLRPGSIAPAVFIASAIKYRSQRVRRSSLSADS